MKDQSAFVQGGTRGIGLALVRALLARPDVGRVYASGRSDPVAAGSEGSAFGALAARYGERLSYLPMDLQDEVSIRAGAERVEADGCKLCLLLNVSGLLHEEAHAPEKRIEDLSAAGLARSFAVNATGPALVIQSFLSVLHPTERVVIGNLSARVGSVSDNRLGGWYGYRASKAAQNMLTKTFSIELARRAPHVSCVALHPGTVDTALSKPFQKRVPAGQLFSAERAASQLLAIVDRVTPEDSGSFYAWDGSTIPW